MPVKNFRTRRRVVCRPKSPLSTAQTAGASLATLCPAPLPEAAPDGGRKAFDRACDLVPAHAETPAGALAALEAEAVRRALDGVEVPVYHQGRECGTTVKHSDQLLMFLLKTLLPERYAGEAKAERAGGPRRRPLLLDIDLSAAAECGDAEAEGSDAEGGATEDALPDGDAGGNAAKDAGGDAGFPRY